jgi:hypothetical protein
MAPMLGEAMRWEATLNSQSVAHAKKNPLTLCGWGIRRERAGVTQRILSSHQRAMV